MGKVNSLLGCRARRAALAGCGGDDDDGPPCRRDGAEHRPARRAGPAVADADAGGARRDPETKHTAADVAFMQGMIHHHAQAIRMTNLVPARSRRRGSSCSRGEWTSRKPTRSRRSGAGCARGASRRQPTATDRHGARGMRLPGMLSEPELKRLAAARGAAFDRLFLTFMIRHHQGALKMVADLYSSGGGAEPGSACSSATSTPTSRSRSAGCRPSWLSCRTDAAAASAPARRARRGARRSTARSGACRLLRRRLAPPPPRAPLPARSRPARRLGRRDRLGAVDARAARSASRLEDVRRRGADSLISRARRGRVRVRRPGPATTSPPA